MDSMHLKNYLSSFGCAGSSLLLKLFSSCGKPGLFFLVVGRFLLAVASLVAELLALGCMGFPSWSTQPQ